MDALVLIEKDYGKQIEANVRALNSKNHSWHVFTNSWFLWEVVEMNLMDDVHHSDRKDVLQINILFGDNFKTLLLLKVNQKYCKVKHPHLSFSRKDMDKIWLEIKLLSSLFIVGE